ncbi:Feline leukemia virus subgroup C receptor-related protein 2 [Blattella germanica]|nr:Feline leukemia virus subgroup C receptor-related protein 2 [Blattella germanica]
MGEESSQEVKLYVRRYFILFIFACFALMNSFQWVQYSILANIVEAYYGVGSVAVDWTSMIFLVSYIILIIPAAHFLDKKGLRWTIVLGTLLNAAGACVKIASVRQDLFWVTFIGQTLAAMASVFMISIPPCLAAAWFGENEVSTACSIGLFGNEMGIALGFYVPTLLVSNSEDIDAIGNDLSTLFYISAGVSTSVFIIALIFFQDKPPTPPSRQQAELVRADDDSLLATLKRLLRNRNYVLLIIVYCFSQAGGEKLAGELGFIFVLSGMIGGVIFGIILDKTHKYNGFLGGYMPIAYDFGAELTYPEPDGMTSGILTLPTQIFGVAFTLAFGQMIAHVGTTWMNVTQTCSLLIGTLIHILIKSDLRRKAMTIGRGDPSTS